MGGDGGALLHPFSTRQATKKHNKNTILVVVLCIHAFDVIIFPRMLACKFVWIRWQWLCLSTPPSRSTGKTPAHCGQIAVGKSGSCPILAPDENPSQIKSSHIRYDLFAKVSW